MAESTSVALAAAPIPSTAEIKRAQKLVREDFVHEGEDPAVALAPGTPRRRALDGALAELEQGAKHPSTKWRRRYSLMLGLERLLSQEEPKLADGTVLSAHQVDALSGTLTALLAEAQRAIDAQGNGSRALAEEAAELISVADTVPGPMNGAGIESKAVDEEPEDDEEDEEEDDEEPAVDLDEDEDDEDEDEEEEEEEEPEDVSADAEEEPQDWVEEDEEEIVAEQPEDPNAAKRFWFEHATGAGKTVAALGFVEASQTGGILILTHRRNLVDQFIGELKDRGYSKRISRPLYVGEDSTKGPVTVETYQWFVRNAGRISSAYTIVICDEAHTALGDKTSAAIREWTGPIFIGMTATGALIARHVTDLFPTQTSRFDLAQAARRGVISPLRCMRIPPGVGVRTIAKVPLRRGEVDTEFDQEELAQLLDQQPFNLATADLYKTRFNNVPGVVYAAGVKHAYNLAEAFRAEGIKAKAVSGETPKRELASILARYENGEVDVLINAQLLAEGWNSPRATLCMHLAPTASKRIYQQRVGPRHTPPPGQGGRDRGRLRAPGHQARRPGRHAALAARPRRLPRRRDRRRAGAPRPGPADAGRAPCAAGHAPMRSGAPRSSSASSGGSRSRTSTAASSTCGRRWRARAWRPAAGARRARRCCTSTSRRAEEPVPDHRGAAQQERPAAAASAEEWPRCATPTPSTPLWTSSAAGHATSAARA